MKREKIKVKQVACFLSERDFQKFDEAYRKTLCLNRSQYMRKMLLGKPVTIRLRNSSLDDFIEIAVKIRKDFAAILVTPSLTSVEREILKDKVLQIEAQLIKVVKLCSQE